MAPHLYATKGPTDIYTGPERCEAKFPSTFCNKNYVTGVGGLLQLTSLWILVSNNNNYNIRGLFYSYQQEVMYGI